MKTLSIFFKIFRAKKLLKNLSCGILKKLAAILLLALFGFNTFGFYFFVTYAKRRVDVHLETKLDAGDYNESELVTVKIPLNLPYQTNWQDFERVNGEININNTTYKYVRRKVYNDTLILQCIAATEKTTLQKKADDYFGKVNSLPGNDTNKKADSHKQFYYDYEYFSYSQLYRVCRKTDFNLFDNPTLVHQYLPINGQPPEFV